MLQLAANHETDDAQGEDAERRERLNYTRVNHVQGRTAEHDPDDDVAHDLGDAEPLEDFGADRAPKNCKAQHQNDVQVISRITDDFCK